MALDDALRFRTMALFACFAGDDPVRWQRLIGCQVIHATYGQGVIAGVRRNTGGTIMLEVTHSDRQVPRKTYPWESFCDARFFDDLVVPRDLDTVLATIQKELVRQVETKQRRAEEAAAAQERARRRKRLQRACEAADAQEFAALKRKYDATGHRDPSPASPLYPILLKLAEGTSLSPDDHGWLKAEGLHATIAHSYEMEFQRTADPRRLVWASSEWRRAARPRQALALTDHLLTIVPPEQRLLRAQVFTTRGGALRDLHALDDAVKCAREAIHCHESPHPHNLLGAIYFMRGMPEAGVQHFQRALDLGSSPRDEQTQMAGALQRSNSAARRAAAKYLLRKDPARYNWARAYLR